MSLLLITASGACGEGDGMGDLTPLDPDTAPRAQVDRFSAQAGTLFVRDGQNGLPQANEPIDFDQQPFLTQGLGPGGEVVQYYNFDVMPTESAPIFVLFHEGADRPVSGQLNIIDVIPGDEGYSDFWHLHKVTVPDDYVANSIASLDDLMASGYPIERTEIIVNCPVVPAGSTASKRHGGGSADLVRGWYREQVVTYFEFAEASLSAALPETGHPAVPLSPIYVLFNLNPDPGDPSSGPASGFVTEPSSVQTHNVPATLPGDPGYSPLWMVHILDRADFATVLDLPGAEAATELARGPNVNCPIVDVRVPSDPQTAEVVAVDRFSADAGTLFVRDAGNGLPAANEPIDFDQAPFITKGLGPAGGMVEYYNFDVMPLESAPIFVLFREGAEAPVERQLNIIDVIPGEAGYNDFWHVHKVTVPADYAANTVTSLQEIMAAGYPIERTTLIVNCPVVPDGSTADVRAGGGSAGLTTGWYRGMAVKYFEFAEATLTVDLPEKGHPMVPVSPIYVMFAVNPDPGNPQSGPASGFAAEAGTDQTHNVVQTLPSDADYSPLWAVNILDNMDFDTVFDLSTAQAATMLGAGPTVNCPIVVTP